MESNPAVISFIVHHHTYYTQIFGHIQAIVSHLILKKMSRVVRLTAAISYRPLFQTMKEKGITSYQLQKMGFNRATYYSMKSGKSVSTNTICLLCKLLQCRVEDVMEYVDDE